MKSIEEYHCCSDCIFQFTVPTNIECTEYELTCKNKRPEVNRTGGLTRCPIFEDIKNEW